MKTAIKARLSGVFSFFCGATVAVAFGIHNLLGLLFFALGIALWNVIDIFLQSHLPWLRERKHPE